MELTGLTGTKYQLGLNPLVSGGEGSIYQVLLVHLLAVSSLVGLLVFRVFMVKYLVVYLPLLTLPLPHILLLPVLALFLMGMYQGQHLSSMAF